MSHFRIIRYFYDQFVWQADQSLVTMADMSLLHTVAVRTVSLFHPDFMILNPDYIHSGFIFNLYGFVLIEAKGAIYFMIHRDRYCIPTASICFLVPKSATARSNTLIMSIKSFFLFTVIFIFLLQMDSS